MLETIWRLLFRDKKYWDRVSWKDVCQHPCMEFSILHEHVQKIPMIRKYIHLHPDFPPSLLLDYTQDWIHFSKTVPMDFVVSTLDNPAYHWIFRFLCTNPTMTPSLLQEHFWPYLSHDVQYAVLRDSYLFQHPLFSLQDLSQEPYRCILHNVHQISKHPGFRPSWLPRIPQRRWSELDWKHLSRTLDPAFIEKTWDELPWSIADLSHHRRLPFSLVIRHKKHKKWDWEGISLHVSLETLERFHSTFPFRYPVVSKNLHLRAWFVREHPTKKWDRLQLAMNPALTPKDIWADPLLFPLWRWDHVIRNPSLDTETLEKMHRSVYQRLGLFKNHGKKDLRYVDLQVMRIHRGFLVYQHRHQLRNKVAFLHKVHARLPRDMWEAVLVFV